jgi:hypothetical protein
MEEPDILLAALRVTEAAPAVEEDCVRQILQDMRRRGDTVPWDMAELNRRVANAFRVLTEARLLKPDPFQRCTLTPKGRRMLRDHEDGLCVLASERFLQFPRPVRARKQR